jgi:hypothetical protein
MTGSSCPLERVVIETTLGRHAGEPGQLVRTHLTECAACAELVHILAAFRADDLHLRADARVPSAGQVWWRAMMRARLEANQRAGAPVTWMQGVTAACVLGLAVALLMSLWPMLGEAVVWLAGTVSGLSPSGAGDLARLLLGVLERSLPLAVTAAVCLVLGPLMLFAAFSRD